MGAIVVTYTVIGGIKAVTWSDVQQMCVIFLGLVVALVTVIVLLPSLGFLLGDAVYLAGAAGRLNAVTTNFDWNDRFNLWSGLIGSTFLFLSYFGCDQSQVQRYLTGRSIAESRLSLLFNAVAKIPMQFFILFIGAMVFVFYLFIQPPVLFQHAELERIAQVRAEYQASWPGIPAGLRTPPRSPPWRWPPAHHAGDAAAERAASPITAPPSGQMDDAARDQRRAPGVSATGGEKDFQRYQLHLPLVRDPLPAGGHWWDW